MSTAKEAKIEIQKILGVEADSIIGPRTLARLNVLNATADDAPWPLSSDGGASEVPAYPWDDALSPVKNRRTPPPAFLDELRAWAKTADDSIFTPNNENDVYGAVVKELGPFQGPAHRKAVMLEVLRVLSGFESSWNWNEGVDRNNATSMANITGQETGAWQVSYDSLPFGLDLHELCIRHGAQTDNAGKFKAQWFIDTMKSDHPFAIEYAARLLRHTIKANGPVVRGEINQYLKRESVEEFEKSLA